MITSIFWILVFCVGIKAASSILGWALDNWRILLIIGILYLVITYIL